MSDDEEEPRKPNASDTERQSHQSDSSEARVSTSTTRSERIRDRTEQEQEAKRRARRSTNHSRSPTPGASLAGTSAQTSGQSPRRSRRTEEDQEAKRRARDGSAPHPPNHNSDGTVNNTREIAPPKPATPKPSEAVELQAELVDEDEEIERVRLQQQQENERLRAQMEAENEAYRRQLNNNNATVEAEVVTVEASQVTTGDDEGGKSKQLAIAALILILLAGAGVGAYFGLMPSEDPVQTYAPVRTSAPTISPAPTQSPTLGLVYPKPTAKDCQAVISGGQVEGQDAFSTRIFEVELAVSMQQETNVNDILDALRLTTQVLLIPELVGCIEGTGSARKLAVLRHRKVQERNVRQYAIANGIFVSNAIVDQNCVSEGDGPCHRVMTTLRLAVKDEQEDDSVLQALLTDVYEVDDLKSKLLLGSPFESVTLGGIKAVPSNSDPANTNAPASSPTANATDDSLTPSPGSSPTVVPNLPQRS